MNDNTNNSNSNNDDKSLINSNRLNEIIDKIISKKILFKLKKTYLF